MCIYVINATMTFKSSIDLKRHFITFCDSSSLGVRGRSGDILHTLNELSHFVHVSETYLTCYSIVHVTNEWLTLQWCLTFFKSLATSLIHIIQLSEWKLDTQNVWGLTKKQLTTKVLNFLKRKLTFPLNYCRLQNFLAKAKIKPTTLNPENKMLLGIFNLKHINRKFVTFFFT